eukprot:gene9517-10505_t
MLRGNQETCYNKPAATDGIYLLRKASQRMQSGNNRELSCQPCYAQESKQHTETAALGDFSCSRHFNRNDVVVEGSRLGSKKDISDQISAVADNSRSLCSSRQGRRAAASDSTHKKAANLRVKKTPTGDVQAAVQTTKLDYNSTRPLSSHQKPVETVLGESNPQDEAIISDNITHRIELSLLLCSQSSTTTTTIARGDDSDNQQQQQGIQQQQQQQQQQSQQEQQQHKMKILCRGGNSDGDEIKCRYCFGGAYGWIVRQPLIVPCWCSGSLAHVHKSCLEKWLTTRKQSNCDLCKYQFETRKKYKNIRDIKFPKMDGEDVCLLLITILIYITLIFQFLAAAYIGMLAEHIPSAVLAVCMTGLSLGIVWFLIGCIALTVTTYTSEYWYYWRKSNKRLIVVLRSVQEPESRRPKTEDSKNGDESSVREPQLPVESLA